MGQPHTPTQSRMMAVLSDGLPHARAELHACLDDDLAPESAVHCHLTAIRAKLKPEGLEVLCVWDRRRLFYRLVRPVTPPAEVSPGAACAVAAGAARTIADDDDAPAADSRRR